MSLAFRLSRRLVWFVLIQIPYDCLVEGRIDYSLLPAWSFMANTMITTTTAATTTLRAKNQIYRRLLFESNTRFLQQCRGCGPQQSRRLLLSHWKDRRIHVDDRSFRTCGVVIAGPKRRGYVSSTPVICQQLEMQQHNRQHSKHHPSSLRRVPPDKSMQPQAPTSDQMRNYFVTTAIPMFGFGFMDQTSEFNTHHPELVSNTSERDQYFSIGPAVLYYPFYWSCTTVSSIVEFCRY